MIRTRTRARSALAALAALMTMTMTLAPIATVAAERHEGEKDEPCTWLAPDPDDCTPPPAGMVAWWTLDEPATALLAHDRIGANHGAPEGDPVPSAGAVANAWRFDGADDLVRVPHDATLNPGAGDLSIDAWVNLRDVEGTATILEKRGLVSVPLVALDPAVPYDQSELVHATGLELPDAGEILGPLGPGTFRPFLVEFTRPIEKTVPQGYHFYLENGVLAFEMTVAGATTRFDSGVHVGDGAWHLVAVTVDRDDPAGGVFYVDGAPVATFAPPERSGNLDNAADAIIGRLDAPWEDHAWSLDEVELFHRVLTEDEVGRIAAAGPSGKCKIDCARPTLVTYHLDGSGASPRPDLDAASTYPFRRDVDEYGWDKEFLHTFDGLPGDILEATLEIRLVSQGSRLDYNDGISLQFTGVTTPTGYPIYEWGRHMGTTPPWTGLIPDRWEGGLARTFLLDLAALPKDTGYGDLIASMNANGYLDVVVSDDTAVEFVTLTIVRCDCELQPADIVIQAGVEDGFDAAANAPEVATPSASLARQTDECGQPTVRFDETSADRCFGHTFVFEPQCLDHATLEMGIRSLGGLAGNDAMGLGYDAAANRYLWGSSLANLVGTWGAFGQVATVTIDIGTVSPAVLDRMKLTGTLDVSLQDDTAIDYLRLSMKSCCDCETAPASVVTAGREDDFNGTEAAAEVATPSAALATVTEDCSAGPTVNFDETENDRCFGHTFTIAPQCISSAVLEIRMRSFGGLAFNDVIGLGYDPLANRFDWGSRIQALPEAGGSWGTYGKTATFRIDLAATAPAALARLEQTGVLDVFVQDDTAIDYARLHVKGCCEGDTTGGTDPTRPTPIPI